METKQKPRLTKADRIYKLLDLGYSESEVARALKISKNTVYDILQREFAIKQLADEGEEA